MYAGCVHGVRESAVTFLTLSALSGTRVGAFCESVAL